MGYFFFFLSSPIPHLFCCVPGLAPAPLCPLSAIPRMDLESHDRQPHKETWPCPCCHRCCHRAEPTSSKLLLPPLLLLVRKPLFVPKEKKKWKKLEIPRVQLNVEVPAVLDLKFLKEVLSLSTRFGSAPARRCHGQSQSFPLSSPHSTFPKVLTPRSHRASLFYRCLKGASIFVCL